MKAFKIIFCFILSLLLMNCTTTQEGFSKSEIVAGCSFNDDWLFPHIIPNEVPGGLKASDCDFYQYSVENFLAETYEGNEPRFLDWMSVYGVFTKNENMKFIPTKWGETPIDSLGVCHLDTDIPKVITNLTNEAGNRPLIDQVGNYTYYDVRMNKTLYNFILECRLNDANKCSNKDVEATRFPEGSIEIKIAWKIIDESLKDEFISTIGWVKNPVTQECSENLLGVVGYHLAITTKYHPEMIWASFEHDSNNPNCDDRNLFPSKKEWGYFNKESAIPLNFYEEGIPANVCREAPFMGANIQGKIYLASLNENYKKALKGKGALENYKFLGALWVFEGGMPVLTKLQRGALKLANPVMETYYQNVLNCFSCHSYSNPLKSLQVSHINNVISNKTVK